jgi:hypothetical protein
MIPILPIIYFALINIALVILGYLLVRKQLILLSWVVLIVSIAVIYLIFRNQLPAIQMLAIIATTFTSMKVVAVAESYKTERMYLNFRQWVAFAAGWAGMRPEPFKTLGAPALPNAASMVKHGISRVIVGAMLIFFARLIVAQRWDQSFTYPIVSIILLVGFSLILHFGLLSISAGMWRYSGANTYLLFKSPAKATSLTEFWSKRWNLAFSEMTSVAIFRPLKKHIGSPAALMAAFIFSGILHELALSLPVNSGYGLPLLYFIIQGAMVLTEKVMIMCKVKFLQNQFIARIWTIFWVVVPAPLLFHTEFIRAIVWPLAGLKP